MKLQLYFIEGKQIYPIGNLGAVVAANNKEQAINMVENVLLSIGIDVKWIGETTCYSEPKIIFINTNDY